MNFYAQDSALESMLSSRNHGSLHGKGDKFYVSTNIIFSYSPISKKGFQGYRIKLETDSRVDMQEFENILCIAAEYGFKFKNIKILLEHKKSKIPSEICAYVDNNKDPHTGKEIYFLKHISTKKDPADNHTRKSIKISAHKPLDQEKSAGLIGLLRKYI